MWALVQDFAHFIKTGKYSNHRNGHGGLYCPHWGYSKGAMEKIRAVAHEVGYLAETENEDRILSQKAIEMVTK